MAVAAPVVHRPPAALPLAISSSQAYIGASAASKSSAWASPLPSGSFPTTRAMPPAASLSNVGIVISRSR